MKGHKVPLLNILVLVENSFLLLQYSLSFFKYSQNVTHQRKCKGRKLLPEMEEKKNPNLSFMPSDVGWFLSSESNTAIFLFPFTKNQCGCVIEPAKESLVACQLKWWEQPKKSTHSDQCFRFDCSSSHLIREPSTFQSNSQWGHILKKENCQKERKTQQLLDPLKLIYNKKLDLQKIVNGNQHELPFGEVLLKLTCQTVESGSKKLFFSCPGLDFIEVILKPFLF